MINPRKMMMYCMPRSGSNLAMQLLKNYQRNKYGYSPLPIQEFFAFEHTENALVFDSVTMKGNKFMRIDNGTVDESMKSREIRKRLEFYDTLSSKDITPIAKLIYPWTPTSIVGKFVDDGHSFISLERKSKVEQILSQFLGNKTYFHLPKNAHFKIDEPFLISEEYITTWLKREEEYKQLKEKTVGITVYYEDFINDYGRLFEAIGLHDYAKVLPDYDFIQTRRMHNGNKLNHIVNAEEFLQWCEKYNLE